MLIYSIIFYFLSTIAVFSALMVISAKNPVHSVMFLILSFVNAFNAAVIGVVTYVLDLDLFI